jgi:hypothetical protein
MPRYFNLIAFSLFLIISCHGNDSSVLTPNQASQVRDSVLGMASQIAADLSREGPVAWLGHFCDTAGFFMASDGILMFPNYDSASQFIRKNLVKMISTIELSWSDLRVDPIRSDLAMMAASYKEILMDSSGRRMPQSGSGYFTGLAQKTSKGWQLRNAHWSVQAPKRDL